MNFLTKILNHRIGRFLQRQAFIISMLSITTIATLKSSNLPDLVLKSDKVNHVLAFGFLTLMVHISYPKLSTAKKLVYLLGYGIGLELIQFFLPWRSCSVADLVADVIGIITATAGLEIIKLHHKHIAEKLKKR